MADLVKISTPVGRLMWVNVTGPGKLNYNEDGREYTASVILSKEVSKPLIDEIQELYDSEHQKGKSVRSLGYKACTKEGMADEDGEEEYYSFNFKTNATFSDGKPKKITIYNAKANKVDIGDIRIGNGSEGAISGSMKYYFKNKNDGVSLWLNAVQITNLEEYRENPGFDELESGFETVEDTETGFQGAEQKDNPPESKSAVNSKPKPKARPRL